MGRLPYFVFASIAVCLQCATLCHFYVWDVAVIFCVYSLIINLLIINENMPQTPLC
jgi:hypothetical protein